MSHHSLLSTQGSRVSRDMAPQLRREPSARTHPRAPLSTGGCSPKASAPAQSPSEHSWLQGGPQPQTSLTAAWPTPCREHPPLWKLPFLQPAALNTCHLGVPGKRARSFQACLSCRAWLPEGRHRQTRLWHLSRAGMCTRVFANSMRLGPSKGCFQSVCFV